MKRIAVLASGGGSNLQAILDHFAKLGKGSPAKVVLVASDKPSAGALKRGATPDIEHAVLADRSPTSAELGDLLARQEIDFIALAGYLKMIPQSVVDAYQGRMLNVHPALLPSHGGAGMYGQRVHAAVLAAGETVSGATVHLVTHEYDSGPVLAQWPVAVLPDDDVSTLAARVLVVEHALYPRVLAAWAADDRDRFPLRPDDAYMANPPITPEEIRGDIIAAFS